MVSSVNAYQLLDFALPSSGIPCYFKRLGFVFSIDGADEYGDVFSLRWRPRRRPFLKRIRPKVSAQCDAPPRISFVRRNLYVGDP
jgi:hypothetical protein